MNIPLRKGIVLAIVLTFIVCSECFPARTKKAGRRGHNRALHRSHKASHGKVSSTKKDSVNQQVMAAVMQPGKLDMSDERDLDQFQDFNKAFINNEMAAETSLLANQGIDDDSALRISNMAALPNGLPARHTSSKTKINSIKGDVVPITKPFVAGYSPDEYLLDANSWPEYRIKDSDYYNKNYRVFPHAQQEGNYQGGTLGGGMSYGQRMADGMEGPYGDGNYGFQAGPQMVSDEPSPPNPQDEGPEITMSPTSVKIQKLVMKHHGKLNDPTKMNFGDAASNSSRMEGSGSADSSGSGQFFSHLGQATHINPESQGKQVSDVKTTKEESGQVTVDTKPEESAVSSKTPDSVQAKISADTPSTSLGEKSAEQQAKISSPDQQQSNEKSNSRESNSTSNEDSNASKQESNASKQDSNAGKQESNASKQDSNAGKQDSNVSKQDNNASKQDSNASKQDSNSNNKPQENKTATDQTKPKTSSESHNSPLGEFAKFLKAKGITLTINKDKASKTGSSKESGSAQRDENGSSDMKPQSSSLEVLPSTGEPTTGEDNNPLNVNPNPNVASQEASLNNAVMTWQNVSPQANQVGGLFLRHDTKQQAAHH